MSEITEAEKTAIIARLKRARGTAKGKITVLENYLPTFNSETDDVAQLTARQPVIEAAFHEFSDLHSQLAVYLDLENQQISQEQDTKALECFTQYCRVKGSYEAKIRELGTDSDSDTSSRTTRQRGQPQVIVQQVESNFARLPTVELGKFSGNFKDWPTFRDLFNGLVHDRKELSKVVKFRYLLASLDDDPKGPRPKRIVDRIEVTDAGYDLAYQALYDRYENKRLIVEEYVSQLFKMKTMQKESSNDLRTLLEETSRNLRALKALEQPVEHWDTLLVHMICFRLDHDTRRAWENHHARKKELATYEDLSKFLEGRCQVLESLEINCRKQMTVMKPKIKQETKSFSSTSQDSKCLLCDKPHSLVTCPKYLLLKVNERQEMIKKKGLCFRCVSKGHLSSQCDAKCEVCSGNHHQTIHHEKKKDPEENTEGQSTSTNFGNNDQNCRSLLMTSKIELKTKSGDWIEARALVDGGSQSNFMTERLMKRLDLQSKSTNIRVNGIAGSVGQVLKKSNTVMKSCCFEYQRDVEFLIVPKLADKLPSTKIDLKNFKIPRFVQEKLADPQFTDALDVDVLVGVEIFMEILEMQKHNTGPGLPVFQKTKLGWLAGGRIEEPPQKVQNVHTFLNLSEISDEIKKFWEIEEPKKENFWTAEEKKCEKHFVDTHSRKKDGRYTVRMPFKENELESLGDSKRIGLKLFKSTENRLSKSPELKNEYIKFMREYSNLGHMTKVEEPSENEKIYIMPHHPVFKPDSTTTKLRVVFNASEKTTTGKSLNDVMMVGPTIQDTLFNIVIRERKYAIALTADIEKMFRMIEMHPQDRKYQMIVWREDPDEKLSYWKLNVVTYGTAAGPFLSTRSLKQLSIDERDSYPLAASSIKNFYVDDYIGGASTIEEAKELQKQLTEMFKKAGMNLRKWSSNKIEVLENLNQEDLEKPNNLEDASVNQTIKTLGLTWNPTDDVYSFKISKECQEKVTTKRQMLSSILKLFDPIGFLSPVIVTARLMMQNLWLLKSSWDDKLPAKIVQKWNEYAEDLINVKLIKVNRCVMPKKPMKIELHGFCDASEKAYGCCCYIRLIDLDGKIEVNFLCSKFRVAPLKRRSLPQLELCGANLLTHLTEKVLNALEIKFDDIFLWTDSKIVLNWIQIPSYKLKTFVANRVSEIQELTEGFKWHHVSTKLNPADLLSRGVSAVDLKDNKLWWKGPEYLQQSNENWPIQEIQVKPEELPDVKNEVFSFVMTKRLNEFMERHSSVKKFQRYIAYWLRFINNRILKKNPKRTGPLTQLELQQAMKTIIRWDQRDQFEIDYKSLKKDGKVGEKSSIKSLNPFLDNEGIIRVGGRLKSSKLEYDGRHQMLLSKHSELTRKLIVEEHNRFGHVGPQTLLFILRRHYWPVHGKQLIKLLLRNCVTCARMNPKLMQQFMGDLPSERVQLVHPFFEVGVDFAGPFMIKQGGIRSKTYFKSWVSVFVCMATKAVHLEFVQDLTSQSFLQALTRFVSRRGKPQTIHSDNGTNFVGANNELKELYKFLNNQDNQLKIDQHCNDIGIQWKFIPPRSPSMGGEWEAAVKSFKFHLVRIAGRANLTVIEMETILCKIEAILNSRPMFPESSDPNDLSAISPGHFLIGRPLIAIAEYDWTDANVNQLARYQRIQQTTQDFWQRFHHDYLNHLQVRSKNYKNEIQIKVGQLVLLRDENVKPLYWKLAKVVQLHPGSDNITRVVTVKTQTGLFRRAINKLSPLPIETGSFQGRHNVEAPLDSMNPNSEEAPIELA
jgi:hypothetical protein